MPLAMDVALQLAQISQWMRCDTVGMFEVVLRAIGMLNKPGDPQSQYAVEAAMGQSSPLGAWSLLGRDASWGVLPSLDADMQRLIWVRQSLDMLLRCGGRPHMLRDGSRLLVAAIGARVDYFARALFECGLVPVTRAVIAAAFQKGPSAEPVGRGRLWPPWREKLALDLIAAAPSEMLSGPGIAHANAVSPLIEAIRHGASGRIILCPILRRLPGLDLEWRAADGSTALSVAEEAERADTWSDSALVADAVRISVRWMRLHRVQVLKAMRLTLSDSIPLPVLDIVESYVIPSS